MDGFGTCEVGTLDNLKATIGGETGASAKYAAFAKAAKEQGYDQIARLFEATSAAEQIHIGLEYALVAEMEPGFEKPAAPEAEGVQTDLNLIMGAQGDLRDLRHVPAFIKVAQEEGNTRPCRCSPAPTGRVRAPSATWRRTTTSTLRTTTRVLPVPHLRLHPQGRELREVPHLLLPRRPLQGVLSRTFPVFPSAKRNGRLRAVVFCVQGPHALRKFHVKHLYWLSVRRMTPDDSPIGPLRCSFHPNVAYSWRGGAKRRGEKRPGENTRDQEGMGVTGSRIRNIWVKTARERRTPKPPAAALRSCDTRRPVALS